MVPRPRFSLSTVISAIVFGATSLVAVALTTILLLESRPAALRSAQALFREISDKTILETDAFLNTVSTLTDTARLAFETTAQTTLHPGFAKDTKALKALLDAEERLMSAYIGYPDGAFHQLIALRGIAELSATYDAPANTAYIDRTILGLGAPLRTQLWRFLDGHMHPLAVRLEQSVNYDPRQRPWFGRSLGSDNSIFTPPYIFSSSQLLGITCARELSTGSVLGVDVRLSQLADMLAAQKLSENGLLWIIDDQARLVAASQPAGVGQEGRSLTLPAAASSALPPIRKVAEHLEDAPADGKQHVQLDVDGEPYLVTIAPTPPDYGVRLWVAVAAPVSDFTAHIGVMKRRIVMAMIAVLLLLLPLFLLISRSASRSVNALKQQAERIARFDFSTSEPFRSSIKEMQAISGACQSMKQTIRSKTDRLKQTQSRLELLVQEGIALAAEKDLQTLVTLTFQTAQELTGAEGGVLYLKEGEELGVEMLSLGSGNIVLGGLSERPAPRVMVRPAIMSFLSPDSVLRIACETFNGKKLSMLQQTDLKLFPTGLPKEPDDYPIRSIISAPIVTRRDEVLGVVQLFNPAVLDEEDGLGTVEGFIGSLTAQAAVTLDNRNLVISLREVFNSLIQVIATSIDAKSPYTAGHCTRVPVLVELLAQAAHETTHGPLAEFRLTSDEDRRQLHVAAWLHDCGKVTTPEYVVDKATKLETIYNRFHEVRMRFEVLRRDAELEHLARLAEGADPQASLRTLHEALRDLEDDYDFIARCNIGSEVLSEEDRRRIESIARRTWKRYFDDRVGISRAELEAKQTMPEAELPATERLLADKREHLLPRHKDYTHIKDCEGRPVEVPQNEYNRGEIYNLVIQRGTLTPEERFKIKEHILSGMEMLQQVPFPAELSRVACIATEHHETLNGTGYPLRKKKDALCVESRIMAIADIFEALTAADRPYKEAKTLSEALRIMSFMRNDAHIDADLFDIFLSKGVYLEYARRHLKPEQIDELDVRDYMSPEGRAKTTTTGAEK